MLRALLSLAGLILEQLATQGEYWDSQSSGEGYCQEQIDGLKQFGVIEMVDKALAMASITPRRILEIGGGSQLVARHMCARFPDAEVICTDISAQRIDLFNQYYGSAPTNLTTRGGVDARSLPYVDGEFDLIIGDAMLHHIDFLKPALFEIRRCLAPGGKAIFVREPIVGFLGMLAYRLFQRQPQRARRHVEINYYEYKRMLSQWQYELMMAGFGVRTLQFWSGQSLMWRLRSILPHLTPCYLGFVLDQKIDVKNLKVEH